MNILRKTIAPITDTAWKEITSQTKEILDSRLTARNFVDINGPNGLEQGGISTGRLIIPENQSDEGINYGVREFLPLVEIRKPFELDLWELDNIDRGAKDADLSPLEKAAIEIASFEESAIYEGFDPSGIKGLKDTAEEPPVIIPSDTNRFLKEIGNQILLLNRKGIQGPFTLVLSESEWLKLVKLTEGYPTQKQLQEILGGKVLVNHSNGNSFLVSQRGGDYELVLGQDITLGYDSHDNRKVKLYFTSSFTFRTLSPEALVVFKRD